MDVQIAFYGSQSLLRGSCEFCGSQTFVIDGENACCGSTPDTIRIVDVRRLTSPGGRRKGTLGVKHKARILQAQEYKGQRDLQERWRRHGYQIEKEATVVWKMRPLL